MSYRIIYFCTLGVFVAVFITLLITLHRNIHRPLRRLEKATIGVMKGTFAKIENISGNELGRLMTSFNLMVDRLEKEKAEVKNLIHKLKASENRYKILFENAPVGICLAEKNGDILEINDRMKQITGYSLFQQKPVNLMGICEKLINDKMLSDLHETGRPIENLEASLVCRDGDLRLVRMMIAMLDFGVKKMMLAVIQDITEQKRLEAQLKQLGKLEAIGRLAGGVAHDFNNLLSPILGFGELLLTEFDAGDRRKVSVEKMIKAGYRARDIVRQLLAFSRKQTLEFKPVQLNTVIADFEKLLRRTVREDIEIHIHPEPLPAHDQGGRGPAGAGDHESGGQFPGRHARRRQDLHHHGICAPG